MKLACSVHVVKDELGPWHRFMYKDIERNLINLASDKDNKVQNFYTSCTALILGKFH